ncbi:MAG TPA: alpha/beta hydrolase-fold protein, partial [Gemmatimonadaceae bacterium]|nr:alpha/beta hydrolase-fold protein [Gemmatimonadaceae bacterium]
MPMLLALTALLVTTTPRVEVVVPANIHAEPITGRAFVFFSHDTTEEPRLQAGGMVSVPFFGQDIDQMAPGTASVIDEHSQGYPLQSMTSLPEGDYYAQAIVSVYTKFVRADGHTIWAHMDEWEGQQFNRAPGTLVSAVQRVHVGANGEVTAHFEVSRVLPTVTVPADSKYVKYVKIQSQILTKWWGHPIYLGAVVLLPKGYDEHPSEKYPAIWEQGHFSLQAPFGFTLEETESAARRARRMQGSARESGAEFAKSWLSDGFPQMVAFRILHPSPYYDDSYAVNSANNGPYGDAIMQELIPYLETHYRVIRQPYARVLTGGSTGGWEALALQVYYPQFYGGTWVFYPDPVDFRRYEQVNIYSDTNAFWIHRNEFITQPRPSERLVDGQVVVQLHEENQLNNTRGSRRRGGENFAIWEAVFGPTDKDGYPAPIWNDSTGVINRDVAMYWRDHYDIRYYLDQNWSKVGPDLVGKLHIFCGDEDNYYLNLAVYLLQDFLEHTKAPAYGGSFAYGRPLKPHGWQPTT